jgi:NAD(P)-dependent dehydrogenase (short-subunit alcohol dehydrogenase family)
MTPLSLVTGGNRGISREVCRQLASRGHTLVLTAWSADAATAARAARAEPLGLDVTRPGQRGRRGERGRDRYGRLDVLVKNAATTYDSWQRAAAHLAVVPKAILPAASSKPESKRLGPRLPDPLCVEGLREAFTLRFAPTRGISGRE